MEAGKFSNRLSQTILQMGANPPAETYQYNEHGSMIRMPHLPMMQWNFKDELRVTSRQVASESASETSY